MNILAIDCETTGLDFYHGSAQPFFVTTCSDNGKQSYWPWNVDPITREVDVDLNDVEEIKEMIQSADRIVMHNGKFDVKALATVGILDWPWEKTEDTLIAGHLLASNLKHDLTSMVDQYLGEDIGPLEDELEEAVKSCRRKIQQARLKVKRMDEKGIEVEVQDPLAGWKIADEGDPLMPSAKSDKKKRSEPWRFDYWLPKAMSDYITRMPAKLVKGKRVAVKKDESNYGTVLQDYANEDPISTLRLWNVLEPLLINRGLHKIYRYRMKVPSIILGMENRGVSISKKRTAELKDHYREESQEANDQCVNIAEGMGCELKLPKTGNNKLLMEFCFGDKGLKLPVVRTTDKGSPSLDQKAMEIYFSSLPGRSKGLAFVRSLEGKRKRDTSLNYLESYERFWLPYFDDVTKRVAACFKSKPDDRFDEWGVLHPSLNMTGTDTLRFSCWNPNEQNIGKQGMNCIICYGRGCSYCAYKGVDPKSVRYAFGPAPGREWWALDAKNIELRIPFYVSGQRELIELFEHPNDPPYYGSNHLANLHAVYPDIWEKELEEVGFDKVGPHCKKKYGTTYYQWCKNGGFCKQYGGHKALTDATFRRAGAFDLLEAKFDKLAQLNAHCIKQAEQYGYITTIPDRDVDPDHGYPLLCTRTEWGKVKPTIPLPYFVQGTAMQWTVKGMVRCEGKLREWRDKGFDGYLFMQVHDECVFDLPKKGDPRSEQHHAPRHATSNLWRVRELQRLLAMGGDDIGIPTPCGVEYHPDNWGEGITF